MAKLTFDILRAGAPFRLQQLRRAAVRHNAKPYITLKSATWRNMRHSKLTKSYNLQGMNDNTPIWCGFEESALPVRGITPAKQAWYADCDASDTARGIVYSLPHGRHLAGYALSENGEYVIFPEIFTDSDDAMCAADSHAERIAELEREHAERFNEAQRIESEIQDALSGLADTRAEHSLMIYGRTQSDAPARFIEFGHLAQSCRDTAAGLVERIRANRETLNSEFSGVL